MHKATKKLLSVVKSIITLVIGIVVIGVESWMARH